MNTPWTTEDGEILEMTDEMLAKMRPMREVAPEWLARFEAAKALRGRPRGIHKSTVSISLDSELVAAMRASGKGWQTRVNAALRQAFMGQ